MKNPQERWQKLRAMENDNGASPTEKQTARNLRERLEAMHPGVGEKPKEGTTPFDRQQWTEAPPPPPDTSGRVHPGEAWGGKAPSGQRWYNRGADMFKAAMEEVTRGFALNQMVREHADIEIEGNTRTIHIHVRLPLDEVTEIAEMSGGSLQEYARLVGLLVGAELAATFKDSGY